jgi:hypothetical protein
MGQSLVTAIAILLRHQRAREIAKTQRPCPLMNAVPLGPVLEFIGVKLGEGGCL